MTAAIALGRYLIVHAQAAFGLMGADPVVADARHLLAWLDHTTAARARPPNGSCSTARGRGSGGWRRWSRRCACSSSPGTWLSWRRTPAAAPAACAQCAERWGAQRWFRVSADCAQGGRGGLAPEPAAPSPRRHRPPPAAGAPRRHPARPGSRPSRRGVGRVGVAPPVGGCQAPGHAPAGGRQARPQRQRSPRCSPMRRSRRADRRRPPARW